VKEKIIIENKVTWSEENYIKGRDTESRKFSKDQ
jgi:hypothetical protein